MSTEHRPDIHIAADEINALIHAYLVDSGFIHSAFVLRGEANLDRSPLAKVLFPRGHLTELLAKALLYIEVETHWKKVPGSCNEPFSLTGTHTCKVTAGKETSALATALYPAGEESGLFKNRHQNKDDDAMDEGWSPPLPPLGKNELPPHLQQLIPIHKQEIFVCAWNPVSSDILATGSKDSDSWILQVDPSINKRPVIQKVAHIPHCEEIPLDAEERDVSSIDWSRDGTLLATGCIDPFLRVWSTEKRQLLFSAKEHTDTIGMVRFSPSGRHIITVGLDLLAVVWDVEKQTALRKYQAPEGILQDVAWINDTSFALTWSDFWIHLFLITAPMPFRSFRGHTDEITMVRVSPDRKLLASISEDHTARVWKINPFKMMVKDGDIVPAEGSVGGSPGQDCLQVLRGHDAPLLNCRWAPFPPNDLKRIFVTICDMYVVKVWNVDTGDCIATLEDHGGDIYGIAMSPCAEYYVTASVDDWVNIYSSTTFEIVCRWTDRTPGKNRKRNLYEVDWNKDGKRIAVCTGSGDIAILDVSHLNAKPAPAS